MKLSKIHHYNIHQRLGAGLQGTAYLATDTKLNRPVVLKIVHEDRAFKKRVRLKILEEARMASAIQHPNVCAIYEVSEFEERPYMVMEYVNGKTLQELIEEEPLNIRFALSVGIQVAEGLGEAHRMGILHRDLKPANIKVTEAGLVKILDFGLARRRDSQEANSASDMMFQASGGSTPDTSPLGAVAYMAPEQFVTLRSTEQSDIFSLGVILYEIITGNHPFWVPESMGPNAFIQSIKTTDPVKPGRLRDDIPPSLEKVILRALDKQPANRFRTAQELAEALKTLMKSLDFESGTVPGERSAVLPSPGIRSDSESGNGLFSKLTAFFMQAGGHDVLKNSIAVLPFKPAEEEPEGQRNFFGLALADAVANRLVQNSSVRVRSPGVFLSLIGKNIDEIQVEQKLNSEYLLTGSYFRSDENFTLNWQFLKVSDKSFRTGGTIRVPSLDLVQVQSEITDEIVQTLFNLGRLDINKPGKKPSRPPEDISEEYLEARALLFRFLWGSSNPEDLEESREKFASLIEKTSSYAPAYAGLGRVHLNYVTNGIGGHTHFMAAQRYLDKALEIDPGNVEAKLQRSYTYLWRGEKEKARYDIQYLLKHYSHDAEVCMIAGIIFQLDGLYESALRLFGMALQNNPSAAPQVYNRRARIYHYLGKLDMAWSEVKKGLALEPEHSLLRTTEGYLYFRSGEYEKGIPILESVIKKDPSRRITYPTLAMCYVKSGDKEHASKLITDELLAISATDCEMAYRMATYCVVEGNISEALHWLRKTIYLGYENYPWIMGNPAWKPLHDNTEFKDIVSGLKRIHERNKNHWNKFLSNYWDP